MSDLKQAIDQVKRFRGFMQAVIDLGDAVERIESLEHATAEAAAIKVKALKERDAAEAELEKATARIRAAEANIEKAQVLASGVLEEAKAGARKILSAAERDAEKVISKAHEENERLKESIEVMKGRQLAAANAATLKQAELADLEAKIVKARKQAEAILKG